MQELPRVELTGVGRGFVLRPKQRKEVKVKRIAFIRLAYYV